MYSLCGSDLPSVSIVTNLGVSYVSYFSFRPRINNIVSKVSLRAKQILKCFVTRDRSSGILRKAFCVFVRPILEFSSVIWSPCFKMDISRIESVQKCFTKACLPNMPYDARLSTLGLQMLETRRIVSDLITCYKLINNYLDIDCDRFLSVSVNTHTRSNSKKLTNCHVENVRNVNLFHNRVVP